MLIILHFCLSAYEPVPSTGAAGLIGLECVCVCVRAVEVQVQKRKRTNSVGGKKETEVCSSVKHSAELIEFCWRLARCYCRICGDNCVSN